MMHEYRIIHGDDANRLACLNSLHADLAIVGYRSEELDGAARIFKVSDVTEVRKARRAQLKGHSGSFAFNGETVSGFVKAISANGDNGWINKLVIKP